MFGRHKMSVRFRRILFPTDFSDLAAKALPFARELAETFRAPLHCLHVVDDAYQYWTAIGPEGIPLGPPPTEFLELGQQRMQAFVSQHLVGVDPAPTTCVRLGRPFLEIITYAREQEIDSIVMGTHGRGPIAHALLGSTTEKVVRKSPCPVLTVRTSDEDSVAS